MIDTSILLPAIQENHPNHKIAADFVNSLLANHEIIVLNTYLVAELYNNLTKRPTTTNERIHFVHNLLKSISERFEGIELSMEDYLTAVERCATLKMKGGVIYDALHFQAAIKAGVDILYTSNIRDFERLVTDEISFRVESPY